MAIKVLRQTIVDYLIKNFITCQNKETDYRRIKAKEKNRLVVD